MDKKIFFMLVVLVFAFGNICIVSSEEPTYNTDVCGVTTSIDYSDNSLDTTYDYWNSFEDYFERKFHPITNNPYCFSKNGNYDYCYYTDCKNKQPPVADLNACFLNCFDLYAKPMDSCCGDYYYIKSINIGNGKEVYKYDGNQNLLSEEYSEYPEMNKYYTYNSKNNLIGIKKNGVGISFGYDSNNKLTKEYTYSLDGSFKKGSSYAYDSKGNLVNINEPGKKVTYSYGQSGEVLQEHLVKTTNGNAMDETYYYEYDSNLNLIKMKDNLGEEVTYDYETEDYSCSDIQCTNTNCPNPDECITLYDCSSGTCTEYLCKDYEFVDKTCTYDQVASKSIENYKVDVEYSDDSISYCVEGGNCYTPTENYNGDGALIEDDFFNYGYDSEGKLKSQTSKVYSGESSNFEYNSEGLVSKQTFEDGSYEVYTYDPLNRVYKTDYYYPSSYSGITGSVIKSITGFASFFTGKASDTPEGYSHSVFYSVGEDFVPLSEFNSLVDTYESENGNIGDSIQQIEAEETSCNDISCLDLSEFSIDNCGDEVCSLVETIDSCPSDCVDEFATISGDDTEDLSEDTLTTTATLQQVIDVINAWVAKQATLQQVIDMINAWVETQNK